MKEEKESKYKQDGVNVKEGDSFSEMAGEVCRSTFENSEFVEVKDFSLGHFRGPRGFKFKNLPDGFFMDAAPDGIGTKVVVIDAALAHRHSCRDVLAMTASDITRWGGLPLIFVNILDVSSLGETGSDTNNAFREMIIGLGEVAKREGLVCFRGETAELGACVASENNDATAVFNWGGFMLGVYHPNRMITGDSLKEGQTVIALQEKGFRSNGLSAVRAALKMKFGDGWANNPEASEAITEAARPSTLYDRIIAQANGWSDNTDGPIIKMHSVSHISGGGIVGKFAEDILFPRGLSARLNGLFSPPEIMKQVAKWRGITERECYKIFNCGNGMLVVVDEMDVDYVIATSRSLGIKAKRGGKIVKRNEPSISIRSGFSGETLIYGPEN